MACPSFRRSAAGQRCDVAAAGLYANFTGAATLPRRRHGKSKEEMVSSLSLLLSMLAVVSEKSRRRRQGATKRSSLSLPLMTGELPAGLPGPSNSTGVLSLPAEVE